VAAALYNRYRPKTFAEVVGQGHVTEALLQALRSAQAGGGGIHHAYLFSGPRGCGKTSSARILAASLNCVHGPTPDPCGICDQCMAIRAGNSVDVIEIDAASHGSVDDARDLRERAAFSPAGARYRVFVVDEAHMISKEGFNALLKIVEEPPDYAVFVFATTDPEKVLATIRSRSFHYQFGLVPPAVLARHLSAVAAAEGVAVEPAVVPLVVRVAEGSVRDSLSVLDQLIAGSGSGGVTYASAVARLGLTDAVLLDDTVEALAAADGGQLFGVVERVVGAGQDARRFATDLLERLRDLILLAAVPDARERGLLELVPDDQLERMRAQSTRLGAAELSRAADVVSAGLLDMRGTIQPRMVLELICARLLLPAASGDTSALLARLDQLERRLAITGSALPAAPPTATTVPLPSAPPPAAPVPGAPLPAADEPAVAPVWPTTAATGSSAGPAAEHRPVERTPAAGPSESTDPTGAPASATGALDLEAVRRAWPLVVEAVKRRGQVPYAVLAPHGTVSALEGALVTVSFALAPMARRFSGAYEELTAEAITEVLGGRWRVKGAVVGPAAGAPATAGSAPGFAAGDAPDEEPDPGGADDDDGADADGGTDGDGSGPRAPSSGAEASTPRPGGDEDAVVALLRARMGATVIEG